MLVLAAMSCRKDEPGTPPEIVFVEPAAGSVFSVMDTIDVVLRIESPEPTADLNLRMEDDRFVPVLPALSVSGLGTNLDQRFHYPVDKHTLASGNYLLRAEVTADGQKNKAYLTVFINEIPLELESVWIVQQTDTYSMRVQKGNMDEGFSTVINRPGSYSGSAISSRHRLFFLGAALMGDLGAFDTENYEQVWEVQAIQNPQQSYFTLVHYDESLLYTGMYEGQVKAWNMQGQNAFATTLDAFTVPERMFVTPPYLVVVSQQKGNPLIHWLQVYFAGNGELHLTKSINFSPVVISQAETRRLLILGNDENGKAIARMFDPDDGHVGDPYQPFDLPEQQINCGTVVSGQSVLYACNNGIYLYKFQESNGRIADYANIKVLNYESETRIVWAADGNTLYTLTMGGQLLQQLNPGGEIKNIHFLYTR